MSKRPRILFLPLEFYPWEKASHHGYCAQLAIEEGLSEQPVDVLTIPAMSLGCAAELPIGTISPILESARRALEGQEFDQVWLELVHSNYDQGFLEWVSSLAPVRVGFIGESLTYTEHAYTLHPQLRGREGFVKTRQPYMTHVLCWDESDVERLGSQFPQVKYDWWPQVVPPRKYPDLLPEPTHNCGVFIGAVYGERAMWINDPALRGLVVQGQSLDARSEFPEIFDRLYPLALNGLASNQMPALEVFAAFTQTLRLVRRRCFELWIKSLQDSAVVVNLPQLGRGFAGRVVEGMLAGRVVATHAPEGRPRACAQFEDGAEVLLYTTPLQLADHIRRVVNDRDLAKRISTRARQKVLSSCTTTNLVNKIFSWTKLQLA